MIDSPGSAGKCFNVTDAGNAPMAGEMSQLLADKLGARHIRLPSTALLPLAYIVEWWSIASAYVPILPPPGATLIRVQPALWSCVMVVQVASNERASLSPEKGGIGYRPQCTSLEGISQEIIDFLNEKDLGKRQRQTEIADHDKKPSDAVLPPHIPMVGT